MYSETFNRQPALGKRPFSLVNDAPSKPVGALNMAAAAATPSRQRAAAAAAAATAVGVSLQRPQSPTWAQRHRALTTQHLTPASGGGTPSRASTLSGALGGSFRLAGSVAGSVAGTVVDGVRSVGHAVGGRVSAVGGGYSGEWLRSRFAEASTLVLPQARPPHDRRAAAAMRRACPVRPSLHPFPSPASDAPHARPPQPAAAQSDLVSRVKLKGEPLDIDVIDTSWMDSNVQVRRDGPAPSLLRRTGCT